MITECYIKGRYDSGVGKCAVVITQDVPDGEEKSVLHQAAWTVPPNWVYNGETIEADQFNCEILAACYVVKWCTDNEKPLVNIYANTASAEKWYYREQFPETRSAMGHAYSSAVDAYYDKLNKEETVLDRIYADYVPQNDSNYFNTLANDLAENVK